MSLHFLQPTARMHPQAVRAMKGQRDGNVGQCGVDLKCACSQREASPEAIHSGRPAIYIRETDVEQLEKLAYLMTALAGHQPQMCRHHLHTPRCHRG